MRIPTYFESRLILKSTCTCIVHCFIRMLTRMHLIKARSGKHNVYKPFMQLR